MNDDIHANLQNGTDSSLRLKKMRRDFDLSNLNIHFAYNVLQNKGYYVKM